MSWLLNLVAGPLIGNLISGLFGFFEARIHDSELKKLGYDAEVISADRATIAAQRRIAAVPDVDRAALLERLRDGTQ